MAAAYLNAGLYSMISVPLVSKGKIIGTLNTESCTSEQYGNEELELATRIGAQVTNAVSNSLLYEQALQLAEEREARARLDAENRELQRINEAKIAFLSTVSHELRTPLTSMLAFTDIIHRNKNKNLTEREISHLEVIRRNGRRLSLLIGDLLDVSRIESGALNLDITEFSMNEMIDDLYESFQPLLERKHQTMKLEVQASETLVLGDQDRLAQVVSNLMSNAHKYSGESALIVVSMRADDSRVYLSVKDQGIGISEEDLSQLFTAFFRAENEATRAEQGTGLGLVIVKGIVEMHGGMIKVESEPGAGTTFHIEFNRRFAQEQEEKTRKAA
jgi:signal transduction histidine kinase